MKFVIACVALFLSLNTFAQTAPTTNPSRIVDIAIGTSVPPDDPAFNVKSPTVANGGPATRRSGGEVIGWAFFTPGTTDQITVTVTKIRLIGYSTSGRGRILVRDFNAVPALAAKSAETMFKYGSISPTSHAQNYNGLVLLGNGDWVEYAPAGGVSLNKIFFIFEAFADDDASVDVQLELSPDPSPGNPLAVGFGRVIVNKPGSSGGSSGGAASGGHSGGGGHSSSGDSGSSSHGGCQMNGDCGDGYSCDMYGHCRAVGGEHPGCQIGGSCNMSGDCCSGDCHFGACRSASGGTGGPGENCNYNSDCYSHNCGAAGTCKP